MQIRTIFHNANFLKKSTPNADERAAVKAGRRLVCVLLMFVMCASAVWGAEYRWKNDAASGDWTTASNWEVSTNGGSLWGEASSAPGDGDNVTFSGAANANIVVTLPSNFTPWLGNLIINSSNAGPYTLTIKCESGTTSTLNSTSKLCIAGCDGGSVNLVLDGVNLNSGELRINDNLEENRYDGTITISNNGTGSITASKLLIFGDAAVSPNAFCVNFTNVPVAVSDTIEINWDEKSGIVEVATDATLGGNGRINIGKANWVYGSTNSTTTVFSGSGTISTSNFNFPDGTSHHLKLDGNITLDTGSMDVAGSGGVTIEGTGNLSITYPVNQDDNLHLDPDVNVSKTDGTYTYSVTVGSFDGFGASGSELEITVTGTTTDAFFSEKTLAYEFSGSKFSLDGVSGDTITIPADSTGNTSSKTFKVTCTSELSEDDGFEFKIRVSNGGAVIKTVSWTLKTPKWKGLSTEWNSVSNWDGIYYMKALESLEADVQSTFGGSAVSSFPVISSNAKAKKLTIGNGATVTQTGGTFTVENIALSESGKFISTGGEVVFSKSGTWSDSSGTSNFTDVTIPSGVTLTLGSDLTVAKLTVASGGTLDCNGHTLTITDSSAIEGTVTAAKFTATGMGGKTLTINGTLSVGTAGSTAEDTLKLEGSSIGSKLNISGTGTIKLNATQPGGKWLNLSSDAGPVVKDLSDGTTVKFWTTYSTKTGTTAPSGWTVFAGDSIYEWTGATDTAWTTDSNWNTNAVPEAESIVKINTVGTGRYPVTPATETTVATLSVGSGASITLGAALTVSGVLTNEGTVDTNGKALSFDSYSDPSTGNTGTIKVGASNTVSSTAAATVGKIIFSGTRTGFTETTFTNIAFTNIEVAANSSLSLGDTLSVSGKLTNAGIIDTNGYNLSFNTLADTGTIKVGTANTLSAGTATQTVNNLLFTAGRTDAFSGFTNINFKNIELTTGTLTLGSSLSLSGTLTNNGTITTDGKSITAGTFAGSGGYTVSGEVTLSSGVSGTPGTVASVTTTDTTTFTQTGSYTLISFTVDNGNTLTLGSSLILSGTLTNAGIIDTNGYNLSFNTLADTGTIKVGAANTLSAGTATQTVNNLLFTAGRTDAFSGFPKISFNDIELTTGTLTLGSNLSLSGTLTNNGTITTDGKSITAGTFAGSGIIEMKGTVSLTGGGSVVTLKVTNTASLTTSGSATYSAVTVNAGTLTLKSNLTVGTLTNNGTINIDNKSFQCTTYAGNSSDSVLANGGTFTAQSGTVHSARLNSNTINSKIIRSGSGTLVFDTVEVTAAGSKLTVTNNDTGTLTFGTTTFSADATLAASVSGSASVPAFTTVTVNSGKTLTLGSDLTVGTLTNKGTVNAAVSPYYNLTVSTKLENQGTVKIGSGKMLSFEEYSNSASVKNDSLTVTDGTVVSTGSGGTIRNATLNGTVTVEKSGAGALYINTVTVSSAGSALTVVNSNSSGTLTFRTTTFSANATLTASASGSASVPAFTTVTVNSGKTLTLGSDLTVGTLTNKGTVNAAVSPYYNLTVSTKLENQGTVKIGSGKMLSFEEYSNSASVKNDSLTVTDGTVVSTGSGGTIRNATLNGTVTVEKSGAGALYINTVTVSAAGSALTVVNSNSSGTLTFGTLAVDGSTTVSGTANVTVKLTATADLTVAGSVNVDGTLTATNCNVTVNNGKTLAAGKFVQTASSSGKSLSVAGTLTVGGSGTNSAQDTLRLSGTASYPLTVSGDGVIRLNKSQVGGSYLTLDSTHPSVTQIPSGQDIIYTAIHSTGTSGNGWNICSGDLVFVWQGGYSGHEREWGEEHNWSVHIVPDLNATTAAIGDVVVEIPSAATYNPVTSGVLSVTKLTVGSSRSLTINEDFTVTTDCINVGDISLQSGDLNVQQNLTNSGSIHQNGDVAVSGGLTNTGTINMNGNNLTFATYSDTSGTGVIKIGATGNITATGTAPCGTINKLIFTGTRPFSNIPELAFRNAEVGASGGANITLTFGDAITFTGTLTNYATVVQNGNLTTGALTNYGTIDMQNSSLFCASYYTPPASTEGIGTIKLGTGTLSPGSGGKLNNIEFTATRNFENITNLTITNGKVNHLVTIQFTSDILSFTGNLTNNGTITLVGNLTVAGTLDNIHEIDVSNGKTLQFSSYAHTGTGSDIIRTNAGGGTIKATGAAGTVSALILEDDTTVTNNGSGALKFTTATVNADVLLTSGGSGSAPVYSTLTISGSNTLTLASDLTAGTVNIGSSATLDADNRGKNADPNFAGYILTVSGNFINNNSTLAETDSVQYRGFIPQSGKVVFTGNGGTRHDIKGSIKFNDFYCHEAGAKLIFDTGTTINVVHQIDVEGAAGQLIEMTTDSAVEGEKWTLDVIWDVAAGTPEHPKPKIKYVAPHKSISYSAILKGCLDNCQDDVTELLDSTNVNWFNDMPTILMTLAPVGGRQLFVLFSTEVTAASGHDLRTALALKTAGGSSIIDAAVPLTSYTGRTDKSKTAVIFGLTRDLTWGDLYGSDCLHVEVVQTSAIRVGTTRISYQQGVSHCTSDFAVNAARMLYGFDNYIDSSTPLTIEKGTNSVRTWDQSDPISNRLHSDSDLLFQTQFDSSVPEDIKLEMTVMLASQLDEAVIGDNYGAYYDLSTRLWLPEAFQPVTTSDQPVPAAQKIAQDSTSSGRLRNFSMLYDKSSSVPLFRMKDGEEIQFLFKVKNPDGTDLLIDHDYDEGNGVYTPTPRRPVYAIRLVDDDDITTFDLWSVMLQTTTLQRGNVTILNNVINPDQQEETFVTIQLQKAGSLTVQVLTLDGSVITTLERGRKQPGTYGYSWDGTNGKGRPVARGMYFVRVIGPDIDETRKVMVVRD